MSRTDVAGACVRRSSDTGIWFVHLTVVTVQMIYFNDNIPGVSLLGVGSLLQLLRGTKGDLVGC